MGCGFFLLAVLQKAALPHSLHLWVLHTVLFGCQGWSLRSQQECFSITPLHPCPSFLGELAGRATTRVTSCHAVCGQSTASTDTRPVRWYRESV